MRRTIFLALLAALLIAPVARADETAIYKDCQDDSRLEGHYSVSELRQAKADLPSDVDEYSDCRDVLSRAIADKTSASSGSQSGGSSGGAGGGSSGGGGGSGGSGASSHSGANPSATPAADSPDAAPVVPSTPQDSAALSQAATQGSSPVNLDGGKIVPGGASRLAADVGRNSLPLPLVLVLIGLAAGVIGGTARRIRNRGVPHAQP
jgi:hypothetical protein